MEFRQIRYFLEIARAGSFQKAAGRLGLTQPALSRQIALLERELEQRLLERGPREVRLTQAGEVFLGYAVRLNDLWRELADSLRTPAGELSGEYAISAGGTVAAWILPGVLKKIRSVHPDVALRVQEGDAQESREALLRGEVDLGILSGLVEESGLVQTPFLTDRIVPVAARDHALFQKRKLRLDDLRDEGFVLFHPASAIRRAVEKKLRVLKPAFRPRAAMELRSVESVLHSLEAGLGPGFISELSLTRSLRVLPFPELVAERTFYLCHRRNMRPGLALLISAIQRFAPRTSSGA